MNPRQISVVGLGKLGLPLAVSFASKGFPTIGLDVDSHKVAALNRRATSLYEPRLQELLDGCNERLRATQNYDEAIQESDVTFIIVPTPTERDNGFSLKHVLQATQDIGRALSHKNNYHLVVLSSTVLPGAMDNEIKPALESHSGKRCGEHFGLCYNPEFVALGNVIRDFLNPDFVLIGESDPSAGVILESLYKNICDNNPPIARMNFVNAEITKLAVNTFVTAKITFANMLARICEKLENANVDIVTSALGMDSRVGPKYLKGAIGYGGPCFPRDNVALAFLARKLGVSAGLAEAIDKENRMQVSYLSNLVKSKMPQGGVVGILGFVYKPNTDVVEESQGLLLAKTLISQGISVVAYDPAGMENAKKLLDGSIRYAQSAEQCIQESDAIIITTPWEEFQNLSPHILKRSGSVPRLVIDCWRLLDERRYNEVVNYIPLGTGF